MFKQLIIVKLNIKEKQMNNRKINYQNLNEKEK